MTDTDIKALGYDFKHEGFVREVNGVKLFAASKATVLVAGEGDQTFRKICQITFHKGSLFVQFTYFGDTAGIVAKVDPIQISATKWQMNLGTVGKLAPSLVKYSHPQDGRAHFSQDGKLITSVWRDSFPLSTGRGPVFEIHAFQPTRFDELAPTETRAARLYAPFFFEGKVPRAIAVNGLWWPITQVRDMRTSDRPSIGPLEQIIHYRSGGTFRAFFVASDRPSPSHLLAVSLGPIQLPEGVDEPMLIFMGGWDADSDLLTVPSSCIACMYPTKDPDTWAERIGSLGYTKPCGGEPTSA
jgi:hypothetical protein